MGVIEFSFEQYLFGYIVAMLAGIQNAFSMNIGIGKTGFLSGTMSDLGVNLAKGNNVTLQISLILFFIIGTISAFFLTNLVGTRTFILIGIISITASFKVSSCST